MNYKSEIVLLGAELTSGESIRVHCPRCEGGSKSEKSLSVTRDENGKLVWQCFRASCDERGTTQRTNNLPSTIPLAPKPRKQFTGQTVPLSDKLKERIQSLWGITDPPHWYWTPDYGGRIAMSVRSPKYLHRGWSLRDIRGNAIVKTLTYIDKDEEGLSWYKTTPHTGTVLVEDIASAVRASKYINSVALLGTGIGDRRALEIAEHATRPIILALDQDATSLSFRWGKKWGLMWGDVQILPLDKDMKNMTEEELMETLNA